jgi:hypothetical protein
MLDDDDVRVASHETGSGADESFAVERAYPPSRPFTQSTYMCVQPAPPTRAMSEVPEPSKSPTTTRAPGVAAKLGKFQ